jgi:hypothetical protein
MRYHTLDRVMRLAGIGGAENRGDAAAAQYQGIGIQIGPVQASLVPEQSGGFPCISFVAIARQDIGKVWNRAFREPHK